MLSLSRTDLAYNGDGTVLASAVCGTELLHGATRCFVLIGYGAMA